MRIRHRGEEQRSVQLAFISTYRLHPTTRAPRPASLDSPSGRWLRIMFFRVLQSTVGSPLSV
ncbi:hypothetical protein EYF80_054482 [Liparis tanakae]|uniref:Uncharacterized protein n=1 Tax=Liparis tanakae TaxID=230148 RepID=A0A4Z2F2J5_9TELE|nr:hypothetical protein EYF80_054482 [Liparis tanakae]